MEHCKATTALRADFCRAKCLFPFRHTSGLSYVLYHHGPPWGKNPSQSKILWFPEGSFHQIKVSMPAQHHPLHWGIYLLRGFWAWGLNMIPHVKRTTLHSVGETQAQSECWGRVPISPSPQPPGLLGQLLHTTLAAAHFRPDTPRPQTVTSSAHTHCCIAEDFLAPNISPSTVIKSLGRWGRFSNFSLTSEMKHN